MNSRFRMHSQNASFARRAALLFGALLGAFVGALLGAATVAVLIDSKAMAQDGDEKSESAQSASGSAGSGSGSGSGAAAGANSGKSKKDTKIDFEDQLVEGQAQKPELFYLLQQRNANFKRLIRLREDFLPEMRSTADEIQRKGSTK